MEGKKKPFGKFIGKIGFGATKGKASGEANEDAKTKRSADQALYELGKVEKSRDSNSRGLLDGLKSIISKNKGPSYKDLKPEEEKSVILEGKSNPVFFKLVS